VSTRKLRNIVSVIVIGGHFLICLLVIWFHLVDWLDETDFMLVLCIAVPALTPYTTLAYKHYATQGLNADNAKITENWFWLMTAPVCLILVLFAVILAKIYLHRFDTIASFATALLLGESLFGIYAGIAIHTLFG